jgi:PAS domain S-box-containing protein
MSPSRRTNTARTYPPSPAAMEQTLAECAAKLAACPADHVDSEIRHGLQAILHRMGADRASCFVIDESGSVCEGIHSVHHPNAFPEPEFYSRPELPWVTKMLLRGDPIIVSTLDDLPPDAQSDRSYLEQRSVKSLVMVPCSRGLPSRCVLVIVCLINQRKWSRRNLDHLNVLGNIFASALIRKKAQMALKESDHRFRYLLNEAPIGIALEDLNGKVILANPALCSMLGYTVDEMLSLNCSQFSDPDDGKDDWKHFQAMQAGLLKTYNIEKRYTRKDGSHLWARLNVSFLKSDEREPLIVATVEDITEKKEALLQLQRTHGELQMVTSGLLQRQEEERARIARELHDDIGQRLSLLTMEINALKDQLPIERAEEHGKLCSLAGQLEELVMDVHNMSHQLHSSKLKYLGLGAALRELCRQFSSKHQVSVELTADPLIQPIAEEVSLCLYRVAQEALSNAVRHSTSGRVEVKLNSEEPILRLHVKDFGVGFDPLLREQGLGFVAMQERLRIVGGKLLLISSPGRGTEIVAEVTSTIPSHPEKSPRQIHTD